MTMTSRSLTILHRRRTRLLERDLGGLGRPRRGPADRERGRAIADDGTIEAVGAIADLGKGEHHDGCIITPGFVNAHSHLEYAVYAGFGDGLPFVPWIGTHIQRKDALDFDDMTAIATVGAHESLRSGVTTVGDCSFSGATALAAASSGLRAIVYLEVFSTGGAPLDRFDEAHARIEHLLSNVSRWGSPPCAVHVHDRDLSRLRGAGDSSGNALRRERGRARLARQRRRRLESPCALPGTPSRRDGDPDAGRRGPARSKPDGSPLCARRRRGDRSSGAPRRGRCALSSFERLPRLRGAPLAELRDAGVAVSIATDSPASTPSLDMFEEIRAAIVAARARAGDPG